MQQEGIFLCITQLLPSRKRRSGYRIPVEVCFSSPVQPNPEADPPSCTMGTGSFPGVKRLGRGVDHPPPSRAEVKERALLYFNSLAKPFWPVLD